MMNTRNNDLKDSLAYYLAILVPLILIFNYRGTAQVNTTLFFLSLFVYVFLYRPVIDTFRLLIKGVIKQGEFRKTCFMFGRTLKYFKELYLP